MPTKDMPSKIIPSKIGVDGVGKSFETEQGTLHVLDNISFDVGDGDIVAIVGPSGCGKSTLMNIMAGFDRPDRGSVRVDGDPLSKPSSRGILISQAGSVFPWLTVQQNLMFGLTDRDHARQEGTRGSLRRDGGPEGLRAPLSARAFRRHDQARGTRARAGRQAGDSLHG